MEKNDTLGTRELTWKSYFKSVSRGWRMIFEYFKSQYWPSGEKGQQQLKFLSKHETIETSTTNQEDLEDISYGIRVLSNLSASLGAIGSSFILNIQPGLHVSKIFALLCYFIIVSLTTVGIFLLIVLFLPMFGESILGLTPKAGGLTTICLECTQFWFVIGATVSNIGLIFRREFIHNFFLHKCGPIIRLPKRMQQEIAIETVVYSTLAILIAEPLFSLFFANKKVIRDVFFPNLTGLILKLALNISSIFFYFLFFIGSVGNYIIPWITCIISQSIAKSLQIQMDSEISEIRRKKRNGFLTLATRSSSSSSSSSSIELTKEKNFEEIVNDFATYSLASDWPNLDHSKIMNLGANSGLLHRRIIIMKILFNEHLVKRQNTNWRNNFNLMNNNNNNNRENLDILVSLYMKLLKKLYEFKEIIQIYDKIFGSYHISVILMQSALMAQWIVVAVVQSKLTNVIDNDHKSFEFYIDGDLCKITSLMWYTAVYVVSIFLLNSFLFARFDRLPNQLLMLRSQMFTLNINNLITETITIERRPINGQCLYVDSRERELLWELHDQLVWAIKETNFKLVGNTFYSVNCLQTIFNRIASLVLLYIQVIDIYITT